MVDRLTKDGYPIGRRRVEMIDAASPPAGKRIDATGACYVRAMNNLEELAGAYGVATTYENWQGVHVAVDPEVIAKVLDLLDTSKPPPPRPTGVAERAE